MIRPTVLHRIETDDRDARRLIARFTATNSVIAREGSLLWQALRHRPALLHAHGIGLAPEVAQVARRLRVPWVLSLELTGTPPTDEQRAAAREAGLVIVSSRAAAEQAAAQGISPERVAAVPFRALVDLAETSTTEQVAGMRLSVGVASGLGDAKAESVLRAAAYRVAKVLSELTVVDVHAGDHDACDIFLTPGVGRDPMRAAGLRAAVTAAQVAGSAILVGGPSWDVDEVLPPGIALALDADERTITRGLVGLTGDWRLREAMGRAGRGHAALRFEAGAVAADLEEQLVSVITTGRPAPVRQPVLDYPTVSVVMVTHNRRSQLRSAVAALRAQSYPADRLEFVIVDNASTDGSEQDLQGIDDDRFLVLREDIHQPPVAARNSAVASNDADVVLFTDDDCAPTPTWVESLVAGFRSGVGIVQGRTVADPSRPVEALSRTQWTPAEYGLYETANVAYRREHLDRAIDGSGAGPFDPRLATRIAGVLGRRFGRYPFGEDADLAWRVKRTNVASRFAGSAVVEHGVYPPDPRYLLRRAIVGGAGFPTLVKQVPELRRSFLWRGVFVSRRQAALVAAVAGGIVAVRRPAAAAAVAPYAWSVLQPGKRGRRGRLQAAPVLIARDVVQLGAGIYGSIRARSLVL